MKIKSETNLFLFSLISSVVSLGEVMCKITLSHRFYSNRQRWEQTNQAASTAIWRRKLTYNGSLSKHNRFLISNRRMLTNRKHVCTYMGARVYVSLQIKHGNNQVLFQKCS